MPSETPNRPGSYTLIYRIYRRIRYIRYVRKKRKALARELKRKDAEQARSVRNKEIERIRAEKKLARKKARFEKEEQKRIRREALKKIRENRRKLVLSEEELGRLKEEKENREKAERKRKRKRMLRFWLRLQFRYTKRRIRSINKDSFRSWYRAFRDKRESRKRFFLILVNSTIYSILAYFTIYLFHQLAMIVTASFFQFPATLYYHEIYFHITADDWTADAVKSIYVSGPLVVFLTGIIFFVIYQQLKDLQSRFKVFFLWGSLHAVSFLFGGALIGSLFETGLGHAISWMYIMDTGKVFTSIISLFFLFVAGLAVRRPFFFSANSYFPSLNSHNRNYFLSAQVLLPYLLAFMVILLIRMPHFMFYESLVLVTTFISILPVLVSTEDTQDLYFEEEEKNFSLDWKSLIVLIMVVVVYRVVLEMGLKLS